MTLLLCSGKEYTRANVLPANMFCVKLDENSFYVGLIGSDEGMRDFAKSSLEHIESHSINIFDKCLILQK